ncbi:MAG: phage minor capsid protein [Oscillospiraceae bacterium]
MLTPNQLDKLPEPVVQLMSKLQDEIISDICRRITKANYLTPTAEWQLYKANQLTISAREVKRRIAAKLKVQESTLKEIYTDAVKTAIREDEVIYKAAIAEGILSDNYREKLTNYTRSKAFSDVLKRGLKNTNGLMRNLTNSAAAAANRQLSDALDLAYLKCASGAFTPQEAIFEAVRKLGQDGLKCVSYESGRTDQLDVAVRRAVVTGIGKTCCDMQLDLAKEMDCELVEVSSHLGARPSHAEWQGQIYSLKKGHPKYPYFYDATGYGTGDGLGGWNCRHSFFPYFEGLSTAANAPTFSKAENLEEYKNTQKQRAYERSIRKSKRELSALDGARSATEDPVLKAKLDREFERKSVTLKKREARLAEHIKATGLLPDNSRVRVDGFGKSVSQKAVWAVKRTATPEQSFSDGVKKAKELADVFKGKITSVKYSKLPTEFRDRFERQLKNCDPNIRDLLKIWSANADIKLSDVQISFYAKGVDYIEINPNREPATLAHELFHRIDFKNGITKNPLYESALKKDYQSICKASNDNVIQYLMYKYPTAFTTDSKGNPILKEKYNGISDIFSAVTQDDVRLGFHHKKSYWQEESRRCASESWANYGYIKYNNDAEVVKMFEELFPTFNYYAKRKVEKLSNAGMER